MPHCRLLSVNAYMAVFVLYPALWDRAEIPKSCSGGGTRVLLPRGGATSSCARPPGDLLMVTPAASSSQVRLEFISSIYVFHPIRRSVARSSGTRLQPCNLQNEGRNASRSTRQPLAVLTTGHPIHRCAGTVNYRTFTPTAFPPRFSKQNTRSDVYISLRLRNPADGCSRFWTSPALPGQTAAVRFSHTSARVGHDPAIPNFQNWPGDPTRSPLIAPTAHRGTKSLLTRSTR